MVTKRFQNSWKLHVSKVIEVYWDCLLLIACFSNESTSIKSREDFFTQYSTDIYVTLKKTGIASNHLTQCFLSWLPKNQGIHSGHNCSHHNHINSQEDSSEIWLEDKLKSKKCVQYFGPMHMQKLSMRNAYTLKFQALITLLECEVKEKWMKY